METKSKNPRPNWRRLRRRNAAFNLPFPERGIVRPGPCRQGIGFASLHALDGSGPSLGTRCLRGKRGELQRGGRESTKTRLRKGAVLQPSGTEQAFKGLGIAKRGDSFVQC